MQYGSRSFSGWQRLASVNYEYDAELGSRMGQLDLNINAKVGRGCFFPRWWNVVLRWFQVPMWTVNTNMWMKVSRETYHWCYKRQSNTDTVDQAAGYYVTENLDLSGSSTKHYHKDIKSAIERAYFPLSTRYNFHTMQMVALKRL